MMSESLEPDALARLIDAAAAAVPGVERVYAAKPLPAAARGAAAQLTAPGFVAPLTSVVADAGDGGAEVLISIGASGETADVARAVAAAARAVLADSAAVDAAACRIHVRVSRAAPPAALE